MGLDNAGFLSTISPAVTLHPSASRSEHVVKQAGDLNPNKKGSAEETSPNAGNTATGVTKSTAMDDIASPASNPSGTLPVEKESDRLHLDASPEKSKFKAPLVAAVQAHGSPHVSGVRAPPPTPETVSNLAVGRLFMDVLKDFPPDRMLSLGDSMHAPKNFSKLRYSRSTAASQSPNQFFSPVPQSYKPREDANFTRMSFKAADTPSAPVFNLTRPESKSLSDPQVTFRLQPQSTTPSPEQTPKEPTRKEPTRLEQSVIPSPRIKVPQVVFKEPDVATTTTAAHLFTSGTREIPQPPPRLEPSPAKEDQTAKVDTPDVPDRPLDTNIRGAAKLGTPNQARYAQVNPFSTPNTPDSAKEVETAKENKSAGQVANADSPAGGGVGDLEHGTPRKSPKPVGELLTPASMTFGAVSPQLAKAAGITAACKPGKVAGEDLEGALYFTAWPKVERRGTRTAAKVRKVMLTGIPSGATPNLVASFVFGGPLERIHVGDSSAFVTFLRGEDAERYYEATENGLDYEKDGVKYVIMTEMTSEVNPVSGILREYIEKEFTRCVRAIGVDREWTLTALHEVAARKGRKVEKIVDGLNANRASTFKSTMRSVNWRFADLQDAVKFKQSLSRSEDWEECNIHFAPDP
ncbi:MAG: hypothetical protein Q9176_007852 [Flavoplaca citrina]